MADNETYEDWTNRETWAVALHINNDQGWQESVLEALKSAVESGDIDAETDDNSQLRWYQAGEIIKDNVETVLFGEDFNHVNPAVIGAIQDIGSLWRVNWTELGASFLRDLQEQEEYSNR